jgi:hypothetical protein
MRKKETRKTKVGLFHFVEDDLKTLGVMRCRYKAEDSKE